MKDNALTECPRCKEQTARRQISRGTGFILKGGGWYSDLYASSSNKGSSSSGESSEGSGTSGAQHEHGPPQRRAHDHRRLRPAAAAPCRRARRPPRPEAPFARAVRPGRPALEQRRHFVARVLLWPQWTSASDSRSSAVSSWTWISSSFARWSGARGWRRTSRGSVPAPRASRRRPTGRTSRPWKRRSPRRSTASSVRPIFTAIDAACRVYEVAPRVAFVGTEGGFGWMATRAHFGLGAEPLRAETVAAAIDEVARSRADFAVVPYESLKDGPILPTILAIAAADLKVVGERQMTQALVLVNVSGNPADVEKIYVCAAGPPGLRCTTSRRTTRARSRSTCGRR